MVREPGAEEATAFISQLEYFKQKRKGGLILGINCSREAPLPSRADNINWIAVISQILTVLAKSELSHPGVEQKGNQGQALRFCTVPMQRNPSPDTGPFSSQTAWNCILLGSRGKMSRMDKRVKDQELIKLFSLVPASIQEFCFLQVECRCPKRKVLRSGGRQGNCWNLPSKDTHPLLNLETLWLCSCQMYFRKARGASVSSCITIMLFSAGFIGKKV